MEDTKKLMNYGFTEYQTTKLNQDQIMLPQIPVKNNVKSDYLNLSISFEEQLLMKPEEQIVYKMNLPQVLNAPVKENQKIGSISIYLDSEYYKDIPIYSINGVEEAKYEDCLELVFLKFVNDVD